MSARFTKQDLIERGMVETSPGVWKKSREMKKALEHKYGAQQVIKNGTRYDSKLEYHFKTLLDAAGIPHVMKQRYLLMEGFKYESETILPVAIVPDYTIVNKRGLTIAIVDTKGITGRRPMNKKGVRTPILGTEDWRLKWKLLKKKLRDMNFVIPLFTPHNKKECLVVIEELKKLK